MEELPPFGSASRGGRAFAAASSGLQAIHDPEAFEALLGNAEEPSPSHAFPPVTVVGSASAASEARSIREGPWGVSAPHQDVCQLLGEHGRSRSEACGSQGPKRDNAFEAWGTVESKPKVGEPDWQDQGRGSAPEGRGAVERDAGENGEQMGEVDWREELQELFPRRQELTERLARERRERDSHSLQSRSSTSPGRTTAPVASSQCSKDFAAGLPVASGSCRTEGAPASSQRTSRTHPDLFGQGLSEFPLFFPDLADKDTTPVSVSSAGTTAEGLQGLVAEGQSEPPRAFSGLASTPLVQPNSRPVSGGSSLPLDHPPLGSNFTNDGASNGGSQGHETRPRTCVLTVNEEPGGSSSGKWNVCATASLVLTDSIDGAADAGAASEGFDLPSASLAASSFLPGLPEDLAWSVLLRVPCSCIQKMRQVCRRWRDGVPGPDGAFFKDRARGGLTEPWLYVSVSDWQGSNACFALEPSTGLWHRLPPIPGSQHRNVLTLQFAAVSGRLLVSGMVERDNPMDGANGVYVYSPPSNTWRRATPINTGRWFCLSGVVDGRLYVAGGIGTSNSLSLVPTVERYSVDTDSWEEMACSGRTELMTLPGYQAVLGGRLLAKNIGWGPRLGVSYNPATGEVQELASSMTQGWQGPTTAVGGKLIIVDFGDDFRVKTWDAEKDTWLPVGTLRLPAAGHKPWAVQLVPFMGRLCVVLPNLTMVSLPLDVVLGDPSSADSAHIEATTVSATRSGGVTGPSSSCPEPSVLTSAVLGCQVLHV